MLPFFLLGQRSARIVPCFVPFDKKQASERIREATKSQGAQTW